MSDDERTHLPHPEDGSCSCQSDSIPQERQSAMESEPLIWFVSMMTLLLSLIFISYYRADSKVSNFVVFFLAIVVDAMPFIALGCFLSGAIEVFVPAERITRALAGRSGPLAGALLGMVLPVCECGIIPVVRRFMSKGVSPGASVAFMLAAPTINPLVIASTAVAFAWDWRFYVGRFAGGLLIAVLVGWLFGRTFKGNSGVKESSEGAACTTSDCGHQHGVDYSGLTVRRRLIAVVGFAASDFFSVGRYLVLGAFVAAFLKAFVNWDSLYSVDANTWLGPLALMLLAFVLNLCSEADAFVAASFQSFAYPAKMAFLWLGPMLDIKLVAMFAWLFRHKAIAFLIVAIATAVYALALAVSAVGGAL